MSSWSVVLVVLVLSFIVNIYLIYRCAVLPLLLRIFSDVLNDIVVMAVLVNILTKHNKRTDRIFDEVLLRAEEKGFKIVNKPDIRVLKRGLGLVNIRGSSATAFAISGLNIIVIDSKWLEYFDDKFLRSIMAHELGHLMDWSTEREGHPLFDKIRHFIKDCRLFSLF